MNFDDTKCEFFGEFRFKEWQFQHIIVDTCIS